MHKIASTENTFHELNLMKLVDQHVLISSLLMDQPSWHKDLNPRKLEKYSMQFRVYDDWRYLHIIGIKVDTTTKSRGSDSWTFCPMPEVACWTIEKDSADEDILLLKLIIHLLKALAVEPIKFQYVFFHFPILTFAQGVC